MSVGEICLLLEEVIHFTITEDSIADQISKKGVRDRQIGDLCEQLKFRVGYRKVPKHGIL